MSPSLTEKQVEKPIDFKTFHVLVGDVQKTCIQAPWVSKPVCELLAVEVL